MAFSETYKMLFQVGTQGVDQLTGLERSVSNIEKGGKAAATSLTGMEGALAGAATKGALLGVGLNQVVEIAKSLAVGLKDLVVQTAQLAEAQQNVATITGLTLKEVGQFSQIAENAGINAGALTTTMRGLSKALSDQTDEGKQAKEAMKLFGVELTNTYGAALPTRELFIRIGESLGRIEEPAKRADLAIKVLGRGGIELLPILNSRIRETLAEMEKLGVGFDERGAAAAKRLDDNIDRLNTNLAVLKRRIGEAAAELLNPALSLLLAEPRTNARGQIVAPQLSQRNFLPYQDELSAAQLLGARPPGPSFDANAQAADLAARRGRIAQLLQSTGSPESRLARQLEIAQREFQQAIQESNVQAVAQAIARIDAIKARIKSLSTAGQGDLRLSDLQAAAAAEAGRRRAGIPPSLFRPGENLVVPSGDLGPVAGNRAEIDAAFGAGLLNSLRQRQQLEEDSRQRELQFRTRLIELTVGPGGEFEAAQRVAAIRIESAKTEAEIREALNDLTLRGLEIQRQRSQEIRQAAGSLFDSLSSRGGVGALDFIRGQGQVIQRTIFQNLAGEIFRGSSGRFTLPGQQNAGGGLNLFGRLLQGTPFGVDPLKGATDLNTIATQANTNALLGLSATVGVGTVGAGGGSLTSVLAAAGIPAGVFQGAGRNPFIFSAKSTRSDIAEDAELIQILGADPSGQKTTLGKAAMYGAAVAAGAAGVVSGIRQGGGRGTANAISAGLGTAAALDPEPISKAVLAIASLAASLVGGILPDPKKQRSAELDSLIRDAAFTSQSPTEFNLDLFGNTFDQDFRGNRRSMPVPVVININAFDSQSVLDHADEIADGVRMAMQRGHRVNQTAREVVLAQ